MIASHKVLVAQAFHNELQIALARSHLALAFEWLSVLSKSKGIRRGCKPRRSSFSPRPPRLTAITKARKV
jgi:hypothetical protein